MSNNEESTKNKINKENFKTIEFDLKKKDKFPVIHRNNNFRSLIIKKIDDEEKKYKNYIKTEINDYFNSPDKYFDNNSPIIVNKKINLKEINIFQKPQNHRLTHKKSNKSLSNLSSIKKKTNLMASVINSSSGNNNIPEELPRYEIIDNEKLKNIFESYKDNDYKKSFIKDYNLDSNINNYPLNISKSLSVQSHRLKSSKNNQKNFRQMSGFLSKRLKKNEKDLLLNSIDPYRYKKEVIKNINYKDFSEIQPRYFWKMNLRREKGLERNDIYVNIKNIYDPFWSVVVDSTRKKKELIFKSGLDLNSKELKDFKKNKYLIDNYSKKIKNVEKLENLNIKGKKLFDVEYNREMSSRRRKILHKVFIENGKEILDTDINDVFGEETFYKNYPKDNVRYEKNKKSNSYMNRNLNNLI